MRGWDTEVACPDDSAELGIVRVAERFVDVPTQ